MTLRMHTVVCLAQSYFFDHKGFIDFDFVRCLAFSNNFKLLHVIPLSFAQTDVSVSSLMALLLDLEIFKSSPTLITVLSKLFSTNFMFLCFCSTKNLMM